MADPGVQELPAQELVHQVRCAISARACARACAGITRSVVLSVQSHCHLQHIAALCLLLPLHACASQRTRTGGGGEGGGGRSVHPWDDAILNLAEKALGIANIDRFSLALGIHGVA